MVEATCTPPDSHVGDFDFFCSNKECFNGPDGSRFILCEYCCFKDKSLRTLLHCYLCHIQFLEEEKKEESDSDDHDMAFKPWHKMVKPKFEKVDPPPALKLLVAYFRSNTQYFELSDLFQATYEE